MDVAFSPVPDPYDPRCPTRLVLDRIGDKWTVLIVGVLSRGTRRFGELRRDVRGISPKVLTQAMRALERDGLVSRQVFASVPPRVEYALTPTGSTLIPLLTSIRTWAETHIGEVVAAQVAYDARGAGATGPATDATDGAADGAARADRVAAPPTASSPPPRPPPRPRTG